MNSRLLQLLLHWAILALGVTLATKLFHGIRCDDAFTLIVVVVVLSFLNAILKPLLMLFTLPFIMLTMGLGVFVINALLFLLVGHVVKGFTVEGFWPALGGALVVSVTNLVVTRLMRRGPRPPGPPPPAGKGPSRSDVIDI